MTRTSRKASACHLVANHAVHHATPLQATTNMHQRIADEPIATSKATTSDTTIVQENTCHHVIMPNDRQRYHAVQDASHNTPYGKQHDDKHAQRHTRRQQYDCQRDNSQASRQTHCRQNATACTQQHILQSGKPTPDRHQIAQQRANKPLNSMLTTRLACRVSLRIKTTPTQHAHSMHEDSNTKTASQTTSNHAASQTNVRYRTVQMITMTASLAAHDA